jgi:CrcB protein
MLLGIGFAGGLTTFSTFAVEVARLLDRSDLDVAAAYLIASVAGGAAAVIAGSRLTALPRSGRRSGTLPW